MYPTPAGERILLGAERHLFTHALATIVDLLADGDMEFGVVAFDELQRNQKLVVLYEATRSLLRPNETAPKLTAYIESAVATVFEFAREQVYQEIDFPAFREATFWRKLVLEAAREEIPPDDLPPVSEADKETWLFLVECLAGRVLWDNDFEMLENLDLPPEKSKMLRHMLGMADDYYTDVPADPPDAQIGIYVDALMGLTADVR